MKKTGNLLFPAVVVLLAFGSGASADTEANKALERRMFEEVWNQSEVDVLDEILSSDYVIHDPAGDFEGAAGYKQFHAMFNAAFSNIHFTIEDQLAEGDLVVTRWTDRATHTGELMGTPATGKDILATGITVSHIVDGRVVEEWNHWDLLGLMQQIGMMPGGRDNYAWGAPSAVTGDPGDPLINKVTLVSANEEVWNLKRIYAMEQTTSIAMIAHNPLSSPCPKPFDSYKKDTASFLAGMPDVTVEVHALVAEADQVAMRYTVRGTHLASGNPVRFTGCNINRFADGKIVENWWAYDGLAMMQGMMAGPEWTPEGTWIVTAPSPMGPLTMVHVMYPLDATGARYGGVLWQVNPNPSFFGTFPEFTGGSQFWATESVRTGPNTYETGMIVYNTQPVEGLLDQVASVGIVTGTWTITGPETNEGESTLSSYMAAQDADGDGLPDEGQEPIACTPFPFTSRRVGIQPACIPAPMPQ